MAELTSAPGVLTGGRLAIGQLRAIAWLRWRILVNGFRRKGGAGELIARILLLPVLGAVALLPTLLAGFAAYYLTVSQQIAHIAWILWVAFALTQLLNINLGQPGTTFDPVELIRFPMPLRRFVLVRLCFGVLSPANIVVSLVSLAVVVGVAVAVPALLLPALVVLFLFALVNILFTRMVFAWVDRWLSTRRAREIFTAFIFVGSLGIQYLNVRFNPSFQRNPPRHHTRPLLPALQPIRRAEHFVAWLPPELSAEALTSAEQRNYGAFLIEIASNTAFGVLFLVIYTLRMRTEFRGENLSDAAASAQPAPPPARAGPAVAPAPHIASVASSAARTFFPSTLGPLLAKELLVMRRNIGLFYGLIAPAVMVFLFAGRLSSRTGSHWVLFGAIAYSLLGISPLSYNSFGYEGSGAQLYFYAPVSIREVFLAKNLFALLLAVAEILLVMAVTIYVAGRPALFDLGIALLWAAGTLLLNTTLGNLRSVSAPKKVNPGRTMNKAQSAVSGYIALGVLAGCAALGFGSELVALYLHRPWIGVTTMALFAAAGVVVYIQGLRGIETYTLERRDTLFEELGKKT